MYNVKGTSVYKMGVFKMGVMDLRLGGGGPRKVVRRLWSRLWKQLRSNHLKEVHFASNNNDKNIMSWTVTQECFSNPPHLNFSLNVGVPNPSSCFCLRQSNFGDSPWSWVLLVGWFYFWILNRALCIVKLPWHSVFKGLKVATSALTWAWKVIGGQGCCW